MHICPDEVGPIVALLTAGPVAVYCFCRHQIGCFCRWCARLIKR